MFCIYLFFIFLATIATSAGWCILVSYGTDYHYCVNLDILEQPYTRIRSFFPGPEYVLYSFLLSYSLRSFFPGPSDLNTFIIPASTAQILVRLWTLIVFMLGDSSSKTFVITMSGLTIWKEALHWRVRRMPSDPPIDKDGKPYVHLSSLYKE